MARPEVAATCVRRLLAQTRRPSSIVVCLNDVDDGTKERIQVLDAEGVELVLLEPGENLGNAGGVQRAMDRAFADGAEAVWILDDDSWPEPGALEALVSAELSEPVVRTSLVVDPETGQPSWPFQVEEEGRWVLRTGIPKERSPVKVRRSWLGAMIPRKVYEVVGPVNGELFLRGEDEDYPRRIERAGFEVYLVPGSVLHHPPGGEVHEWQLMGRSVVLEKELSGVKLYYRLRNAWWILRRDEGTLAALALAAAHVGILLRNAPDKRDALSVAWQAGRDAWRGRLGRRGKAEKRALRGSAE